MNELFKDVPQAIDYTNEIVDKITPPKLKRDILLPNFPLPPEHPTADAFLRHLTFEGAKKRYGEITPEIEERLNYDARPTAPRRRGCAAPRSRRSRSRRYRPAACSAGTPSVPIHITSPGMMVQYLLTSAM